MKEKITPYLKEKLDSPIIQLQYVIDKTLIINAPSNFSEDPLHEDEQEAVKGLVHKYTNRALIKTSYRCAAHCRFCTRFRQIGTNQGDLTEQHIQNIAHYLTAHPEIDDVILSGGDPLYTPKQTFSLLEQIETIASIKVVRIGTRLPIQSPHSYFTTLIQKIMDKLQQMKEHLPVVILLNIEHPDELTLETRSVIQDLRRRGFILLSQTVFLKGVNNSYPTLYKLFQQLYYIGIMPYYLYRCDYVKGVEAFVCDLSEERAIMTQLRSTLSGIACPTYVMDVAGHGKIPVPLNYWQGTDWEQCHDFRGNLIKI